MIILKQLEEKNKSIQIFPFVLKDDYLITKIPAIMQKRAFFLFFPALTDITPAGGA